MPDKGQDPVFRNLIKNTPAFLIWRVENLQLVPVPKDQYGIFYDGDSYVVYAASEFGKFITSDSKTLKLTSSSGVGRLEIHIHVWLGCESSDEDRCVAINKACQLGKITLHPASHHREPMGHESPRFRAYFNHIRLLRGSGSDGNNNFEPRLVRVIGRRRPVVRQTPALDRIYLSKRGVFILDTKDVVFVWIGKESDQRERLQATKVAMKLRDDHKAVSIVFIDQGKESVLSKSEQLLLGLYIRPENKMHGIEGAPLDNEGEPRMDCDSRPHLKLYKCSNSDGIYKVTEIKSGPPLHRSHLDSNCCYILDNWWECVWVWVGKYAGVREQDEALANAQGFIKKKRYPESSTRLTRIIDGAEPNEFVSLFASWPSCPIYQVPLSGRDESLEAGEPSIWRMIPPNAGVCNKTGIAPIKKTSPTFFYSSEAYIIKYTLPSPNGHINVATHWFGEDYEDEVKGRILCENGVIGAALVSQGMEPGHLLSALKGQLVIINGQHREHPPKHLLLRINGNAKHNTSATQVDLSSSSLDSKGVFIVVVEGMAVWVWCGKGSTGDQREMAKQLATSLSMDNEFSVVYQGQEKDEFWHCLGGKIDNIGCIDDSIMSNQSDKMPRLYQVSSSCGSIKVEEVLNYSQSDLIEEDVLLLDTSHTIFIWIGQKAKKEDKNKALHFASEYLKLDVSGRDPRTPVMQIYQGSEPLIFTKLFFHWDKAFTKEVESYENLRKRLEKEKPLIQVELDTGSQRGPKQEFHLADKFPIQTLIQKDPNQLPLSIDLLHKECHLSGTDFKRVFSMDYEEFVKLPQWKQVSLKKQVGLF